jgi:hypothetical protein
LTEPSKEDHRSQHRVEAAIPIRVRGLDAAGQEFEDSTTALEVSRRGLSFLTKHEVAIFANLTVVIPGRGPTRPDEGATDFFTEAAVVGIVKEDEGFCRVRVRFVGATLPMYSAEGF